MAMARHLGISVLETRMQEKETTDIPLSLLYKWQEALSVPVSELLVEPDGSLSLPLQEPAQMVRVMKTAKAILETTDEQSVKRMAKTLVGQLEQIMPSLREVGPWHRAGRRRPRDDLGRTANQPIPDEWFVDKDS
jgi:hypothetical protein